jgi:hypothetical protein
MKRDEARYGMAPHTQALTSTSLHCDVPSTYAAKASLPKRDGAGTSAAAIAHISVPSCDELSAFARPPSSREAAASPMAAMHVGAAWAVKANDHASALSSRGEHASRMRGSAARATASNRLGEWTPALAKECAHVVRAVPVCPGSSGTAALPSSFQRISQGGPHPTPLAAKCSKSTVNSRAPSSGSATSVFSRSRASSVLACGAFDHAAAMLCTAPCGSRPPRARRARFAKCRCGRARVASVPSTAGGRRPTSIVLSGLGPFMASVPGTPEKHTTLNRCRRTTSTWPPPKFGGTYFVRIKMHLVPHTCCREAASNAPMPTQTLYSAGVVLLVLLALPLLSSKPLFDGLELPKREP